MKPFSRALSALISTIGLAQTSGGETIYFLVAEMDRIPEDVRHNDSYVLCLSKPEEVDYARYLIVRNQLGFLAGDRTIVAAWAITGKDGVNRNYLDRKFPEWSWHVKFGAFAEILPEIYDGNPSWVENHVDWTFYGGEYKIGFYAYTVVTELGPYPLYLSALPEGQSVEFHWSGLGTNYVYTLESKESLASTNWFPIPAAAWPLKTNHWTLPLTNAPAHFYRVRAEQSEG